MNWIRTAFWRIFPVFLFFFLAFSLVDLNEILTKKHTEEVFFSFAVIAIAALIMAKVVILSDHMPFIDLFSRKPLVYNTIWKTVIYGLASFLVRILDRGIPLLIDGKGWEEVIQAVGKQVGPFPFWVAQMWLFVLLFIFVAYQELISAVGRKKVEELFFGKTFF